MSFSATPSGPLTEVCEWNFFPPSLHFWIHSSPRLACYPHFPPEMQRLNIFAWIYFDFIFLCVCVSLLIGMCSDEFPMFFHQVNCSLPLPPTLFFFSLSLSDIGILVIQIEPFGFLFVFFLHRFHFQFLIWWQRHVTNRLALSIFFTCKNHPPLSLQSRLSFSFLLCSTYSKLQFWFSQVFAPVLSRGPESNRRFLRSDVVELHNIKKNKVLVLSL